MLGILFLNYAKLPFELFFHFYGGAGNFIWFCSIATHFLVFLNCRKLLLEIRDQLGPDPLRRRLCCPLRHHRFLTSPRLSHFQFIVLIFIDVQNGDVVRRKLCLLTVEAVSKCRSMLAHFPFARVVGDKGFDLLLAEENPFWFKLVNIFFF